MGLGSTRVNQNHQFPTTDNKSMRKKYLKTRLRNADIVWLPVRYHNKMYHCILLKGVTGHALLYIYIVTNLGPSAHLSIFLPHREHLSECTELPCVRLAEIYGRFDGIALLVRLSHLSPPWTRRHHSTNSDLIHAKLLCIHTGEHHHHDSEEPSSHITPCILHTACKRQNFCDQVTC